MNYIKGMYSSNNTRRKKYSNNIVEEDIDISIDLLGSESGNIAILDE